MNTKFLGLHQCTEEDIESRFDAYSENDMIQLLDMHCLDDPGQMADIYGNFGRDESLYILGINVIYCNNSVK